MKNIRVSDELHHKLKVEAAVAGTTMDKYIKGLINE